TSSNNASPGTDATLSILWPLEATLVKISIMDKKRGARFCKEITRAMSVSRILNHYRYLDGSIRADLSLAKLG
ncbi:hypothetical protein N9K20_04760, partial [Methylophilaceae bacterium]|nr:hypothetical protein [Methylophilaceae bacterium]